jgi:hypothetical protein
MTPADVSAVLACTIAGSAIAIRARMLRRGQTAWAHSPPYVSGSLSFFALVLLMRAVAIWAGAHASAGEATVYAVLDLPTLTMLWNLNRHGREKTVREAQIRHDVDVHWEQAVSHGVHHENLPAYHLNAPQGDISRGAGR